MKRLIFSLAVLISLIFLIIFYNKDNPLNSEEKVKSRNGKVVSKNSEIKDKDTSIVKSADVSDECESYMKTLSEEKYENIENRRWSNYHIKYTDGEIYRIRYFFDDGPNGEYKKTVLYKEDETEFPVIVKVFRGFEKESLKDYFDRGEVIWQEQAYEASLNDKSVYWRKINDEFVDLNIDEGLSCL